MKKASLKIFKGSMPPKPPAVWKPEWEKSFTGDFGNAEIDWKHTIKQWFFVYTIEFTIEDAG